MTLREGEAETRLLVDHLFRSRAGQMVAWLTRIFGPAHLDLAEEVVQDALVKALQQWPYKGVPENPGGWLLAVARNGAVDVLRRHSAFANREDAIVAEIAKSTSQPDLDRHAVEGRRLHFGKDPRNTGPDSWRRAPVDPLNSGPVERRGPGVTQHTGRLMGDRGYPGGTGVDPDGPTQGPTSIRVGREHQAPAAAAHRCGAHAHQPLDSRRVG